MSSQAEMQQRALLWDDGLGMALHGVVEAEIALLAGHMLGRQCSWGLSRQDSAGSRGR